jgi:hypothetical protein
MSKREERVIRAFINCVKSGEYSFDYATTLIENTERYGYLSDEAKEKFYAEFEVTTEVVEAEV